MKTTLLSLLCVCGLASVGHAASASCSCGIVSECGGDKDCGKKGCDKDKDGKKADEPKSACGCDKDKDKDAGKAAK